METPILQLYMIVLYSGLILLPCMALGFALVLLRRR